MQVLNEASVRSVLTYQDLIPVMRQTLMDLSAGRVIQPLRSVLIVPPHSGGVESGWFAAMPAVYGSVMGAKLVTVFPGNAQLGKHTHQAMIQLFRSDTGEPLAVMDGRLITEMRTAAVSAVVADALANPNASILAILGSGVQARSHFKALSLVRSFSDVRVWSRTAANARKLAAEIGANATTAQQAVADADIVVTATNSSEPVLFGRWLKDAAVVIAIGAVTPDRRELDDDAMRGPVLVESREAALREPGDILQSGAQITAEIGEVLNGLIFPRKPGPVVFKSLGIAAEDIATAKLVHDKMAERR